jgi:hypothetical protein
MRAPSTLDRINIVFPVLLSFYNLSIYLAQASVLPEKTARTVGRSQRIDICGGAINVEQPPGEVTNSSKFQVLFPNVFQDYSKFF